MNDESPGHSVDIRHSHTFLRLEEFNERGSDKRRG